MFCSKCGAKLDDDAKFCSGCGTAVEKETAENSAEKAVAEETTTKFDEIKDETSKLWNEVESAVGVKEESEPVAEEKEAEAVEETKTEAEAAEQTVSSVETAQPPVFEKDIAPFEEKKKSKKGLIIGISAAAVVAGGAALGYFCFNNELSRLFMGDVGFAKMIESKTFSYMNSETAVDSGEIDKYVAQYMDQMSGAYLGTYNGDDFKKMLDEMIKEGGDSQVRVSVDIEPGLLLSFGGTTNGIFDMISDIELVGSVAHSEEFNKAKIAIEESGNRIFGSDVFITADKVFMLFPELTDKVLYSEIEFGGEEAEEFISQAADKPKFAPEEVKRIREKLVGIYNSNFEKAKIEYGKADGLSTLAGNNAEGDRVTVTWNSELINAMLGEVGDFFRNDEYLRNYFTEAYEMEISEYEAVFDEAEYDETVTVQSVTYYAAHAEIKGKAYYISDGEEDDVAVEFIKVDNGADMLFSAENTEDDECVSFKISDRKGEKETSGNIEFTGDFSKQENDELVLNIGYSDVGFAEYRGNEVPVGTYKLSISEKDKFLASAISNIGSLMGGNNYSYDENEEMSAQLMQEVETDNSNAAIASILSSSYIEWSTNVDGDTLKNSFAININTLLKATINYDYMPYTDDNLVMPDTSNAIDMNGDLSEISEEFQKEFTENITELGEKSKLIGFILEQTGFYDEMNKLEENQSYTANYAAYSEEIRDNASNVAYEISSGFSELFYTESENYMLNAEENAEEYLNLISVVYSDKPKTVKLYYDANGQLTIIDDAGYYFFDFDKLSEYVSGELRSCYVEILSDGCNSGYYRANVVYTDNMSNIPSVLPNIYNYFDGVFEWNGDPYNYIHEGFILGTSEYIDEGFSISKQQVENVKMEVPVYDGYAKDIYAVASEYFSGKGKSFYERAQASEGEDYGTLSDFSIVVEKVSGERWAVKQCLVNNQEYKALEVLSEDITDPNGEFAILLNEKLTHINSLKAEILVNFNDEPAMLRTEENGTWYSKIVYSSVIGVGVVPQETQIDFTSFGAPEYYDYEYGYYNGWNMMAYNKPCVNGVYYTEEGNAYPFGSYCKVVDGPFGGYDQYMSILYNEMLNSYEQ